jgi:chromosome segregation ATPase
MTISPELTLVIVAGFMELAIAVLGVAWAVRKWPTEKVGVIAEASSDNASAVNSYANAFATMSEVASKSHAELEGLRSSLRSTNHRLAQVEDSAKMTELELDNERERRKQIESERDLLRAQSEERLKSVESERDTLKQQVTELMQQVSELPHLRKEIEELREAIAALKPRNGFVTSSGL